MARGNGALGRLVVSLLLLGPSPAGSYPGLDAASQTEARITIDGRTEPGRIPEWAVWQNAFRQLEKGHFGPLQSINFDIRIPEADFPLILEEGMRHGRREQDCLRAHNALSPDERSQGFASTAAQAVTLTCREAILAAADRMFAAVSPEGQQALHRWAQRIRAGMQVDLLPSEEAFYRRPR